MNRRRQFGNEPLRHSELPDLRLQLVSEDPTFAGRTRPAERMTAARRVYGLTTDALAERLAAPFRSSERRDENEEEPPRDHRTH